MYKRNTQKGFTLVEVLVTFALLITIMTITVGAVVTMVDANQKAITVKIAMDNVNSVIEGMARELRVGSAYSCDGGGDCAAGGDTISFTSSEGETITYKFASGGIEKDIDGAGFVELTAPSVTITNPNFYVFGSLSVDVEQPRVLIMVEGFVGGKEKTETTFRLQTTVTQRVPDI